MTPERATLGLVARSAEIRTGPDRGCGAHARSKHG